MSLFEWWQFSTIVVVRSWQFEDAGHEDHKVSHFYDIVFFVYVSFYTIYAVFVMLVL